MRKRASITVFSALAFALVASFLMALLEAGRVYQIQTYADMKSTLAAGVGMRRVSAGALGRISSAGTGWRLRWGYIFHGSCNRCFKRAA